MTDQETALPGKAYVLLLIALMAGPAVVTAALVLMIDARVPDFSKWTEIAQFAIALVFGFAIWGVGFFAYWRQGSNAVNKKVALVAKIQPAFWFLGVALGAAAGVGIIDSAMATRESLASFYCEDVMESSDSRWAKCMEIALSCDDETDAGACGKIGSDQEIKRCMQTHDERRAALTEAQRAEVPTPEGGDYADAMRAMCIVERLAAK